MIDHWMGYYARSETYGFWAAIEKHTGEFLGWFHFRPREGRAVDEPELGYRLVSAQWGKGYATEGSRALIDKGFASSKIVRVVAETAAVHGASRRVWRRRACDTRAATPLNGRCISLATSTATSSMRSLVPNGRQRSEWCARSERIARWSYLRIFVPYQYTRRAEERAMSVSSVVLR